MEILSSLYFRVNMNGGKEERKAAETRELHVIVHYCGMLIQLLALIVWSLRNRRDRRFPEGVLTNTNLTSASPAGGSSGGFAIS